MEYTVSKLAQISGVSARTLRYYDEIGLLKPKRVNSSGYRIYGGAEVDLLQQILFYRELAFSLDEIAQMMHADHFEIEEALHEHLEHLQKEKARLDALIQTVEKSIREQKGETTMTDKEKFKAFKKDQIRRNEDQYGEELREKYGAETIERSNKQFSQMTEEEYASLEMLTDQLNTKLAQATQLGDPTSELGQEVAAMHKEWITRTWPDGYYETDKHYNLSRMYVEDPRFNAYYEKVAPGAAEYLHKALKTYLEIE